MMMLYPNQKLAYNRDHITFVEDVSNTDQYSESHYVMHFIGGPSLEFPPGMTLDQVLADPKDHS